MVDVSNASRDIVPRTEVFEDTNVIVISPYASPQQRIKTEPVDSYWNRMGGVVTNNDPQGIQAAFNLTHLQSTDTMGNGSAATSTTNGHASAVSTSNGAPPLASLGTRDQQPDPVTQTSNYEYPVSHLVIDRNNRPILPPHIPPPPPLRPAQPSSNRPRLPFLSLQSPPYPNHTDTHRFRNAIVSQNASQVIPVGISVPDLLSEGSGNQTPPVPSTIQGSNPELNSAASLPTALEVLRRLSGASDRSARSDRPHSRESTGTAPSAQPGTAPTSASEPATEPGTSVSGTEPGTSFMASTVSDNASVTVSDTEPGTEPLSGTEPSTEPVPDTVPTSGTTPGNTSVASTEPVPTSSSGTQPDVQPGTTPEPSAQPATSSGTATVTSAAPVASAAPVPSTTPVSGTTTTSQSPSTNNTATLGRRSSVEDEVIEAAPLMSEILATTANATTATTTAIQTQSSSSANTVTAPPPLVLPAHIFNTLNANGSVATTPLILNTQTVVSSSAGPIVVNGPLQGLNAAPGLPLSVSLPLSAQIGTISSILTNRFNVPQVNPMIPMSNLIMPVNAQNIVNSTPIMSQINATVPMNNLVLPVSTQNNTNSAPVRSQVNAAVPTNNLVMPTNTLNNTLNNTSSQISVTVPTNNLVMTNTPNNTPDTLPQVSAIIPPNVIPASGRSSAPVTSTAANPSNAVSQGGATAPNAVVRPPSLAPRPRTHIPDERMFLSCQLCSYVAKSAQGLEKHYGAHLNNQVCRYCGKAYHIKSKLRLHEKGHVAAGHTIDNAECLISPNYSDGSVESAVDVNAWTHPHAVSGSSSVQTDLISPNSDGASTLNPPPPYVLPSASSGSGVLSSQPASESQQSASANGNANPLSSLSANPPGTSTDAGSVNKDSSKDPKSQSDAEKSDKPKDLDMKNLPFRIDNFKNSVLTETNLYKCEVKDNNEIFISLTPFNVSETISEAVIRECPPVASINDISEIMEGVKKASEPVDVKIVEITMPEVPKKGKRKRSTDDGQSKKKKKKLLGYLKLARKKKKKRKGSKDSKDYLELELGQDGRLRGPSPTKVPSIVSDNRGSTDIEMQNCVADPVHYDSMLSDGDNVMTSPSNSTKSQNKSPIKSPMKSPLKSPIKSPLKPLSNGEIKNDAVAESPSKFRCHLCPFSATTRMKLKCHIKAHEMNLQMCEFCFKTFFKKADLVRHVEEVHQTKEQTQDSNGVDVVQNTYYSCDCCDYQTDSYGRFKSHENLHKIGRNICAWCGKAFFNIEHLVRHWFTHNRKDKNGHYTCSQCQKKVKEKQQMMSHMTAHYKEEPKEQVSPPSGKKKSKSKEEFTCPECAMNFAAQSLLAWHRRKVHNVVSLSSYQCQSCDVSYTSQWKLKKHISEFHKHTDQQQPETHNNHATQRQCHTCDACGRKFSSAAYLARHAISHSLVKPFKCKGCGKQLTYPHHFRMHQKKCPKLKAVMTPGKKNTKEAGKPASQNSKLSPELSEVTPASVTPAEVIPAKAPAAKASAKVAKSARSKASTKVTPKVTPTKVTPPAEDPTSPDTPREKLRLKDVLQLDTRKLSAKATCVIESPEIPEEDDDDVIIINFDEVEN